MQGTSPDEKRARHEEKQAFDAPTLAPTASPADEEDEMLCRYCFEGTEEGELLSPCKCSGGQKWVHLSCLRRWQRMVLISQPTHPMFYTTDQRHYTCNVCASAFTCAPPTRHELMSSFTGPELGAMMEEGCIIGAHDNFSRELATALDGMPDEIAEVASYQHWTGGVYLITKVTPVDPVANFEIPSANVLSRFNNELGDEGRLTDVRGTVLQLLPVGPLAAAMEAEAPVVAAGEAAMANEAAVASQGADVCAMAVEGSGSGGDGAGVTAGWRARQEMRRIEEGVRSGRLPGLFPLTLTFAKVPPPDCGEDHLTAVNLARPVPHPTPRMLRQVDAAVRRLREALPHVDETRIRMEHYYGGPCNANSVACCVVTGGSSIGWSTVETGLLAALTLAFDRANSRCAEQEPLVGGQAVRLVGLTGRPELNGAEGLTLSFDPEAGRWLVRLADGDGKSLKPCNLRAIRPRGQPLCQPSGVGTGAAEGTADEDVESVPSGGPTVLVFWGDAQWSRVQLLGEIARGHWGLCRASVADLIAPPAHRRAGLDGRLVFAPKSEMSEPLSGGAQMDTMRQRMLRGRGGDLPLAAGPQPEPDVIPDGEAAIPEVGSVRTTHRLPDAAPEAGALTGPHGERLPHTTASNELAGSVPVPPVLAGVEAVAAAMRAATAAATAAAEAVEALVEEQADSEAEAEAEAEVEMEAEEEVGGYADDTEDVEEDEAGAAAEEAGGYVEDGYVEDVEDNAEDRPE